MINLVFIFSVCLSIEGLELRFFRNTTDNVIYRCYLLLPPPPLCDEEDDELPDDPELLLLLPLL